LQKGESSILQIGMYFVGKKRLNSGIPQTMRDSQRRNCNISLKEALESFNENLPAMISNAKEKLNESKAKMEDIEKGQKEHREMIEKQMKKVKELLEHNQKLIEESLEYFHAKLKEFERLGHPDKKVPTKPMEAKIKE
jgi:flagellar hook-basal body complex protein FliE